MDSTMSRGDMEPHAPAIEPLTPDRSQDNPPSNWIENREAVQRLNELLEPPVALSKIIKGILNFVEMPKETPDAMKISLSNLQPRERLKVRAFALDIEQTCNGLMETTPDNTIPEPALSSTKNNSDIIKSSQKDEGLAQDHATITYFDPEVKAAQLADDMKETNETVKRTAKMQTKELQGTVVAQHCNAPSMKRRGSNVEHQQKDQNINSSLLQKGQSSKDEEDGQNENLDHATLKPCSLLHSKSQFAGPSSESRLPPDIVGAATSIDLANASGHKEKKKYSRCARAQKDARGNHPCVGSKGAEQTGFSLLNLVTQPIDDFVSESYEQLSQFSEPKNCSTTYTSLLQLVTDAKEEARWSDGSEWAKLVEAGSQERHMGAISYALTAIAFSRWHESQVRLLSNMNPIKAAAKVSNRVLGSKSEEGVSSSWERRRRSLTTHLTRGRKWSRLVKDFGTGVLFKSTWQLAKSPDHVLESLRAGLLTSQDKMAVLKLMEGQMALLLHDGKTKPADFHDALCKKGLPIHIPKPPTEPSGLGDLYRELKCSPKSQMLLVEGTNFRFPLKSLAIHGLDEWFNDNVILACLHLADKLPFTRVGFSIPTHQQTRSNQLMPRPFEAAAKQIERWHCETPTMNALVCLFPLFQRQNHFSLLEINEMDRSIYHYDSLVKGRHGSSIQAACAREFPDLNYVEKETVQQNDFSSCGPLVIRFARQRMLGRPVERVQNDAEVLRSEAANILRKGWENGVLVTAADLPAKRKKRGRATEHFDEVREDASLKREKRRKLRG